MELSISVADGVRTVALSRSLAANNAGLTAQQYVQRMVDKHLDSLAASLVVATQSKLAFLDRFTVEERVAIRAAGKTDAQINDYLELLNAAQDVSLTSERTVGGVNALEAAGLIAAGRAAQILAL